MLEDLIRPADIISKRIRVLSNGKSLYKIVLEKSCKQFMDSRKVLIEFLAKEITDR